MKRISLLLMTISVLGCAAQDLPEQQASVPKKFESCCGTSPVEFSVGEGNVYIPNVFTPNGDGVNDLFYPYVNSDVAVVQNFTIFTPDKDTVLYGSKAVFYDGTPKETLEANAWKGINWNTREPYTGLFKYGMGVYTKDGKYWVVEGEACVLSCDKGMVVFKTKEGCFYPSQGNSEGKADRNKANQEQDCFN